MAEKKKALVTGFEPFGGRKINASAELMHALVARSTDELAIHALDLPVVWHTAMEQIPNAVESIEPDAILCLGEYGRGSNGMLRIETLAHNAVDTSLADNCRERLSRTNVVPDGPEEYPMRMPFDGMMAAAERRKVPAYLSDDVGAYLCNFVAYSVMHYVEISGFEGPAGFVHVPTFDVPGACPVSGEALCDTLHEFLQIMVGLRS